MFPSEPPNQTRHSMTIYHAGVAFRSSTSITLIRALLMLLRLEPSPSHVARSPVLYLRWTGSREEREPTNPFAGFAAGNADVFFRNPRLWIAWVAPPWE